MLSKNGWKKWKAMIEWNKDKANKKKPYPKYNAIGQIGHSLIPMGLAVLKNQDWILYGDESWILRTCGSKLLEDLWRLVVLKSSLLEIIIILRYSSCNIGHRDQFLQCFLVKDLWRWKWQTQLQCKEEDVQ
jgi:hypothetical protein